MLNKIKNLILIKWKSALFWWSTAPVAAISYVICNHNGIVKATDQVPSSIDKVAKFVLNVDTVNAYFVLLPMVFFLIYLVDRSYVFKRQERARFRSIFEFFLFKVFDALIVVSGVMIAVVILDLFSDIQIVNSYIGAVLFSLIGFFGAIMLQVVSREFFNAVITNYRVSVNAS
ncbi:hypothetical protein [Vibrio atlanticus]|uniref:hypothetical protein n=1 Tax=Vibrio atlanticus TaxID=693153 RepID=UPI0035528543